jgi:hypothetical protein
MTNKNITIKSDAEGTAYPDSFTEREIALLEEAKETGVRPVGATLSAQMMALYLEGYSCASIAKANPPFTEVDILYCRKKYDWDSQKERYMEELASRTRERLLKHKLEAIEFITNQLSVVHKSENEKMMRYMQTGKEEDKPETFVTGSTSYKTLIEILQKITGEERVTKQEIKTQSSVNVNVQGAENIKITDSMQSQILAALAGKNSKEPEDE